MSQFYVSYLKAAADRALAEPAKDSDPKLLAIVHAAIRCAMNEAGPGGWILCSQKVREGLVAMRVLDHIAQCVEPGSRTWATAGDLALIVSRADMSVG